MDGHHRTKKCCWNPRKAIESTVPRHCLQISLKQMQSQARIGFKALPGRPEPHHTVQRTADSLVVELTWCHDGGRGWRGPNGRPCCSSSIRTLGQDTAYDGQRGSRKWQSTSKGQSLAMRQRGLLPQHVAFSSPTEVPIDRVKISTVPVTTAEWATRRV